MSGGTFALLQKKRAANDKLGRLKTAFKKHDKNGDGALNQDEWLRVLRDSGSEMSKEQIESMFGERDRDRDGKLSFEEFTGQETKIEKAFRAMDKDGDGFITRAEFASVCRTLTPEQVDATFAKFDKAGNGKLNYIEFCGMMNAKKERQKSSNRRDGRSGSRSGTPTMRRRELASAARSKK